MSTNRQMMYAPRSDCAKREMRAAWSIRFSNPVYFEQAEIQDDGHSLILRGDHRSWIDPKNLHGRLHTLPE
jgi:hypothetical protein